MKNWSFTLVLGLAYLALFHLWLVVSWPVAAGTASAASAVLGILGWRAWRQGWFANSWDALFHAVVVLDILLEGWLIKTHEGFGFYWCAGAFGAVLAAYRLFALKKAGHRTDVPRSSLGKASAA